MKVMVIGGGGREHAIIKALKKNPTVETIYCLPGNGGIAADAVCVNIGAKDIPAQVNFAKENGIDYAVVAPDDPLALGAVDALTEAGVPCFGPNKAAAIIESSKAFSKDLMKKYEIPTAGYETFEDFDAAWEYVKAGSLPTVLKYDGLAAGKGVVIAETLEQAEEALRDMLQDEKFGKGKVVIEEYLEGPEFSLLCFVNGKDVYPMPVAQDHKRAFDGDKGPNTGGMGAYTELPFITDEDLQYAMEKIMRPTAAAMVEEGCAFCGVLYGGLMKTQNGIKVIEFNARFGDPETEVILPRLTSDMCQVFCDVADGKTPVIEWDDQATLGVVLASKGYPGSYDKGFVIEGTEAVDGSIYHMGTATKDGKYVTSGGRVMIVVCKAPTLREAQQKAQAEVEKIKCDNLFHRTDIGDKAFKY